VGENYTAEVGYVPRKNYVKINPSISYLFFPKGGAILSHGPKISSLYFFNKTFEQTDNTTFLSYLFNFRDQSTGDVWIARDYVQLLQPFDPTNSNKDTLSTGTEHRWNSFGIDYVSKPQKLFTYDFSTRFGGYYANGTRLNLAGDVG
jgi:hypothetical protein